MSMRQSLTSFYKKGIKNNLSVLSTGRGLLVFVLLAFISVSCVPMRKYQDCVTERDKIIKERDDLVNVQGNLQKLIDECEQSLQRKTRDIEGLRRDTSRLISSLELEILKNNQLNKTYELLLQKNKELLAENRYQTEKISAELSLTMEQLIRKEDELKKMEADLNLLQQSLASTENELKIKEDSLIALGADLGKSKRILDESLRDLESSRDDLEEKQKKLLELQQILYQKDSVVEALRSTVAEALLGFTDKGLKVEERHGKVYVSMENKLLFATGSTTVGNEGRQALKELALILEDNPDINVMVEGHTDDVPMRGTGQIKDNWDLSVMRATEIVRILLSGSPEIDPARITAAGRSQYLPVDMDDTPEARAKNRRTEIILTPKLDELFRVIESN